MNLVDKANPLLKRVNTYSAGKPIEELAREINIEVDKIVKLASNECPLGPSPLALKEMQKAIKKVHFYPDAQAYELRTAIAKKQQISPKEMIFGAGSNEILVFIALAFMNPQSSIVISDYSFIIYRFLATMMGAEIISTPTKNFQHQLNLMAKNIKKNTSIVFICNPNNPTGTLVKKEKIIEFLKKIPKNILIVFDEAYAEICLGEMPHTIPLIKEKNIIILRSFSKSYGLAGLRIGYGIADQAIIQVLEKVRQPFNVNSLAQSAALAALNDQNFIQKSKETYRSAKKFFEQAFLELNLSFIESFANFMLVEFKDAKNIHQKLQNQGFITRPMQAYGLKNFLRISFGTKKENRALVNYLKELH